MTGIHHQTLSFTFTGSTAQPVMHSNPCTTIMFMPSIDKQANESENEKMKKIFLNGNCPKSVIPLEYLWCLR